MELSFVVDIGQNLYTYSLSIDIKENYLRVLNSWNSSFVKVCVSKIDEGWYQRITLLYNRFTSLVKNHSVDFI